MPWCLSCWPPSTRAVPQQVTPPLLPSSTWETWKVRLRVCMEGKQEQKGQGLLAEQPPPFPSPGTSTCGRKSLPTDLCCSASPLLSFCFTGRSHTACASPLCLMCHLCAPDTKIPGSGIAWCHCPLPTQIMSVVSQPARSPMSFV